MEDHKCLNCNEDCEIELDRDYQPSFYISSCCKADFLTYDEKDCEDED